jgi:hypothetical protein
MRSSPLSMTPGRATWFATVPGIINATTVQVFPVKENALARPAAHDGTTNQFLIFHEIYLPMIRIFSMLQDKAGSREPPLALPARVCGKNDLTRSAFPWLYLPSRRVWKKHILNARRMVFQSQDRVWKNSDKSYPIYCRQPTVTILPRKFYLSRIILKEEREG